MTLENDKIVSGCFSVALESAGFTKEDALIVAAKLKVYSLSVTSGIIALRALGVTDNAVISKFIAMRGGVDKREMAQISYDTNDEEIHKWIMEGIRLGAFFESRVVKARAKAAHNFVLNKHMFPFGVQAIKECEVFALALAGHEEISGMEF